MAGRRRGRYPPEYKERMIELVRAERSPGSLAREFEPSEQTIRNWAKQADLDEGLRSDGLTTDARKELVELKRENKRLRMERKRDAGAKAAPDLVNRDFSAGGPDRLWVADITYVPTWAGWLYLAVVLDAWSRRIVGWAMAPRMPAALVGDALAMAIARRQLKDGVVHHSDQGSQYTSLAFGRRCREAGVVQSMGSVGDANYEKLNHAA